MRKRAREIFIHILPVLLGVLLTAFMSILVYRQMVVREEESSWDQLDSVALSMAEKIDLRFADSMNLLGRVADAVTMQVSIERRDDVLNYLSNVRQTTIFQRIDILMPDHTIIHESGETHDLDVVALQYEAVVEKGAHYSPRMTDHLTGREVFYCVVPIITNGKTEGLLVGVVDCLNITELIRTYSFDGTAQVFLLDRADGSYLMDNWHDTLGNIYDLGEREMLEGYEQVDFIQEMMAGESGHAAFVSQSNGHISYMTYIPVDQFHWSLAVAAQEDEMLQDVQQLRKSLNIIILVEMCLLVSYLLWNVFIANILVKERENVQQMKLEAATNQAKSLFLSSVSHDIRTPLNGILGMLDVISLHPGDQKYLTEGLNKIRISAEYLVTLADNVLDLNDLESGQSRMEQEPIDLRKLGPELDIIVQSRLKESDVSYELHYGQLEHPFVLGSDGYLHRILTNLISNAIKYNKEKGAIWVTIEEQEAREGASLYRFTVQDTGIGMSEAFQKNMFQAFNQENAGARSSNNGHGLGLAIVDRMVRRMGGTIQVESQQGVGTTFVVQIPFQWDTREEQAREETPMPETMDLTGAKLLLVEDNELNLEIASILLSDAGAVLTTAVNGQLAVEAFASSQEGYFDAILMDIMMPVMDGCEASRAIRALHRSDAGSVPIIAMTASTFAEDIQRCKDAGMDEHIGKPLNMAALLAMIAQQRASYRKHDQMVFGGKKA